MGLAVQHGGLLAQDQDLQVLGGVAAGEQHEQLEGAAPRELGSYPGQPPRGRQRPQRTELPSDTNRQGSQLTSEFAHPRPVAFPLQARWDGATIQVAGSMAIRRPDFGLEVPSLVGFRIQEQGVVELELTLTRKDAALAVPVSTLRRHAAVPEPGQGEPGRPQGPPCRGGKPPGAGGDRLLFAAAPNDDEERLYTIGADGRGLRRVGGNADSAFHMEPSWSPDGRRIAFTRAEPDQNAPPPSVSIIRADRSGRTDLSPGATPDWSPDGRRIAFMSEAGGDGTAKISVMRADGSGDQAITRGRKDTAPAWSRDGRRMSWVRDGNLYLARSDGSGAACVRVGMLLTSGARWQPVVR